LDDTLILDTEVPAGVKGFAQSGELAERGCFGKHMHCSQYSFSQVMSVAASCSLLVAFDMVEDGPNGRHNMQLCLDCCINWVVIANGIPGMGEMGSGNPAVVTVNMDSPLAWENQTMVHSHIVMEEMRDSVQPIDLHKYISVTALGTYPSSLQTLELAQIIHVQVPVPFGCTTASLRRWIWVLVRSTTQRVLLCARGQILCHRGCSHISGSVIILIAKGSE